MKTLIVFLALIFMLEGCGSKEFPTEKAHVEKSVRLTPGHYEMRIITEAVDGTVHIDVESTTATTAPAMFHGNVFHNFKDTTTNTVPNYIKPVCGVDYNSVEFCRVNPLHYNRLERLAEVAGDCIKRMDRGEACGMGKLREAVRELQ